MLVIPLMDSPGSNLDHVCQILLEWSESLMDYNKCTFSLWVSSSNTLFQDCPSWLTVTENSVTIIWVNNDRAP